MIVESMICLAEFILSSAWYVICCRQNGTTLGKQILQNSGCPEQESES